MTWLQQLMGFQKQTPEKVREAIQVDGTRTRSFVNGIEFSRGHLEILSLAELRSLEVAIVSYRVSNLNVCKLIR